MKEAPVKEVPVEPGPTTILPGRALDAGRCAFSGPTDARFGTISLFAGGGHTPLPRLCGRFATFFLHLLAPGRPATRRTSRTEVLVIVLRVSRMPSYSSWWVIRRFTEFSG